MIHDVDETLRALIDRDALAGSAVEVSFEAPSKAWAARQNGVTINVYLYDIHEDLERRAVQYEDLRKNVDGRDVIVDRRLPPRAFSLSYLVTAWTQRPEDEHRLLSALLGCFVRNPMLPEELLQGALATITPTGARPARVRLTVALPPTRDRSPSDVWGALGGELKPSLDVVVTALFDPHSQLEVGPLVTEGPVIKVYDRTEAG